MVYFLKSEVIGSIKIGFCKENNIQQRLEILQIGSADKLIILLTIPDATLRYEAELHRKFKHLHIRSEWFSPGAELLEFIARGRIAFPEIPKPVFRTKLTGFTFQN
jgi:hypothetical protein